MTDTTNGAYQAGKEHVKVAIDGVEYLVDGAGNLYTLTGESLGEGYAYLGEKWGEFLNKPAGAEVKNAYNWTVDSAGNIVDTSGSYIAGIGEGLYNNVWGVKPVTDAVTGIVGGTVNFFKNAYETADKITNTGGGFGGVFRQKGLKGALLDKNPQTQNFMTMLMATTMPEMKPTRDWILTGTDADAIAIRQVWQVELAPYLTGGQTHVSTVAPVSDVAREVDVLYDKPENADALKVVYTDPVTGVTQNKYLTSAQLQMVRNFTTGKKDAMNGYKLKVVKDGTTDLSPLYYYNGGVGANYYRVNDPNRQFLSFGHTELTLTESEYYAAAHALYDLDVKNQQIDIDFANVIHGNLPAAFSGQTNTQPQPQPTTPQVNPGQSQPGVVPTVPASEVGVGVPLGPDGRPIGKVEDDRNFFLSAANWIDNSLFGSIAGLMPFDILKRIFQMAGGCISGLFRTIGYLCEGEYGKALNTCIGWVKDTAVTAGLAYGAYYLSKKVKNLFGSDEASKLTSTITDSLTTTTTVKTETYASLKHTALENASSEEDFNSTGVVAKPDMTGQLDRFATTGTQRHPDDDGTLWRVQVGKSSSTRKS